MKPSLKHTFFRGMYADGVNVDYDLQRIAAGPVRQEYLSPGPHSWGSPFEGVDHARTDCVRLSGRTDILEAPEVFSGSKQEYAQELFERVVEYFLGLWDDSPKIVMHSGGYDSRIMSLALMEVRKRIGTGLFGTVHFRCHQPENDLFREIMRIEGWEEKYWSVWEGPDEDYYDVGREGVVLNGYVPHVQTMNFWSDVVSEEKEWTAISGLGGEVFKYLAMYPTEKGTLKNRALSLLIDHNPYRGEWEGMWLRDFRDLWMPFWGYDYLEASTSCPPEWCAWDARTGTDNIRPLIVNEVLPELNNVDHGKHAYSWSISERRKREMMDRYHASRFFAEHGIKIDPFTDLYGHDSRLWSLSTIYD